MIRTLISSLAILSLIFSVACKPNSSAQHNDSSPVPQAFVKAEKSCLASLKAQAAQGKPNLHDVSNSQLNQEIRNASSIPLSQFTQDAYSLGHSVKSKSVTFIGLKKSTSDGTRSYSVSISLPDSETEALFVLNVESESHEASGTNTDIKQRYKVDTNCEPVLIQTSFDRTTLSSGKITGMHMEEYADGKAGSFRSSQSESEIPAGGQFMDSSSSSSSDKSDWEKTKAAIAAIPASTILLLRSYQSPYYMKIHLEIAPDVEHFDPILNQNTNFHGFHFDLENLGSVVSYSSVNSGFSYSQFGNADETWNVNEALFQATSLSQVKKEAQQKLEGQQDPTNSSRIEFFADRLLQYGNLKSYWSVESSEKVTDNPDGFKYHFILKSQGITALEQESAPLVTNPTEIASNPDLQESTAVEISIAPVQELISQLKPHSNLNRLQMARLVGKIVTDTLKYDYESLKDSSIHPLKTSEVLQRKIGVCQHFANLFAALARGVGIPTRFVVGYYLSPQGVGGHAWNEIEVRPGVWMPIEPQSSALALNPAFYLPFTYGGYMETMNDKDALSYGLSMLIQFDAKVLNSQSKDEK